MRGARSVGRQGGQAIACHTEPLNVAHTNVVVWAVTVDVDVVDVLVGTRNVR